MSCDNRFARALDTIRIHLGLQSSRIKYILREAVNQVEKKRPLSHIWNRSDGGICNRAEIRFEVLSLQKSLTLAKGIVRDDVC